MIVFYPRDIGRWRECPEFDLTQRGNITLAMPHKTHYKTFHDRAELFEFLKLYGVRLDDPEFPLEITGPNNNPEFGEHIYNVVQWTQIGWLKDDHR